jgi:membrane-associated PAP2 superfamily phosphatase
VALFTIPGRSSGFQSPDLIRGCFEDGHPQSEDMVQSKPNAAPVLIDEQRDPSAQELVEPSTDPVPSVGSPSWHAMITNLPADWYRAFDFSFRAANLPEFVGVTAFTGVLLATDKKTWTATRRAYKTSSFVHVTSDYAVDIGDGTSQLGFVSALAAYGFLAGDKQALRTASQSVEAVLATGVAVQFLKHVTGRESPITTTRTRGRWKFFPHLGEYQRNEPRYYAFPSGHISSTMALLTVVMNNYPDQKWIKPVGYAAVGLLGTGLVAKGMHWYSDFPLGLAMGYLFGNVVSRPENLKSTIAKKETPLNLSITPVSTSYGMALRLGVSF